MLKASSKFVIGLIHSFSALVLLVPINAQGQTKPIFSPTFSQNTSVKNDVGLNSAADSKNTVNSIEPHQEIDFQKLYFLPSRPRPLLKINVPTGLCLDSAQDRAEEQKRFENSENSNIVMGSGSKCPNDP